MNWTGVEQLRSFRQHSQWSKKKKKKKKSTGSHLVKTIQATWVRPDVNFLLQVSICSSVKLPGIHAHDHSHANTVYLFQTPEKILSLHELCKPLSQTTWRECLLKNSTSSSSNIWKELSLNIRQMQLDSRCMCGNCLVCCFCTRALSPLSACSAYSPTETTLLAAASAEALQLHSSFSSQCFSLYQMFAQLLQVTLHEAGLLPITLTSGPCCCRGWGLGGDSEWLLLSCSFFLQNKITLVPLVCFARSNCDLERKTLPDVFLIITQSITQNNQKDRQVFICTMQM